MKYVIKQMKFFSYVVESVISLAMLALLVLLLQPAEMMSPSLLMVTEVILLILFGIFASFVWQERTGDEREELHRMLAGRIAFLVGAAVLLIGIVVQTFLHALDPWLVTALAAMVVAKMIGNIYGRMRL